MDALLDQIKQSVSTADENTKKALIHKLRSLADSLETPDNTLDRISFGVSQDSMYQQRMTFHEYAINSF